MRKLLFSMIMAVAISLCCGPLQAATTSPSGSPSPVDLFTGKYWVNSSETEKEAYLLGIESAIDIENVISLRMAENAAKAGKTSGFTLSPFEKGWMDAFGDNTPRRQIAADVDKWYSAHPDQLDRPVLSVIWYEVIEPRLKAGK